MKKYSLIILLLFNTLLAKGQIEAHKFGVQALYEFQQTYEASVIYTLTDRTEILGGLGFGKIPVPEAEILSINYWKISAAVKYYLTQKQVTPFVALYIGNAHAGNYGINGNQFYVSFNFGGQAFIRKNFAVSAMIGLTYYNGGINLFDTPANGIGMGATPSIAATYYF